MGNSDLADDLLEGAEAIARFMYGDERKRRRVYHLADDARGTRRLPCFRLGSTLCARKSTLVRWIEANEARAA